MLPSSNLQRSSDDVSLHPEVGSVGTAEQNAAIFPGSAPYSSSLVLVRVHLSSTSHRYHTVCIYGVLSLCNCCWLDGKVTDTICSRYVYEVAADYCCRWTRPCVPRAYVDETVRRYRKENGGFHTLSLNVENVSISHLESKPRHRVSYQSRT